MLCHISVRVKAECDRCGEIPAELHMPEHVHGWYCPQCCPVCHSAVQPRAPDARAEKREDQVSPAAA